MQNGKCLRRSRATSLQHNIVFVQNGDW